MIKCPKNKREDLPEMKKWKEDIDRKLAEYIEKNDYTVPLIYSVQFAKGEHQADLYTELLTAYEQYGGWGAAIINLNGPNVWEIVMGTQALVYGRSREEWKRYIVELSKKDEDDSDEEEDLENDDDEDDEGDGSGTCD